MRKCYNILSPPVLQFTSSFPVLFGVEEHRDVEDSGNVDSSLADERLSLLRTELQYIVGGRQQSSRVGSHYWSTTNCIWFAHCTHKNCPLFSVIVFFCYFCYLCQNDYIDCQATIFWKKKSKLKQLHLCVSHGHIDFVK